MFELGIMKRQYIITKENQKLFVHLAVSLDK
jgi:hypothetical protein